MGCGTRTKAQCSLASTPNAVPHRRVAFSSIASNSGHEIAPGRSMLLTRIGKLRVTLGKLPP